MLAQGMEGIHVDLVDIGALLAVDLDIDEMLVHELSNLGILETLMGHYMAPVTSGITDRQKHRLVLCTGTGEGIVAPRLPMNRVVSMLEKVWAGFVPEKILVHRPFWHEAGVRSTSIAVG